MATTEPAWAAEAIKDVVEAASDVKEAVEEAAPSGTDWFQPWVDFNSGILSGVDDVLEDKLGLAGTFGFAIIGYTVLVKALTFPLNQSSLRANAMNQLLAPKIKFIQTKYKNDQETQNRMMMRLWDDTGVNPLSGCVPAVIQFPIFIGLYRAINQLSTKNVHFAEPFLWIPSLSGPVRAGEPSLDWLVKSQSADSFVPLIGWEQAGRYVILPVILVASQFATTAMQGPQPGQQQGGLSALVGIFPIIIGYTCLVSPAGLGLYWFCNNVLTAAQTQLIKKQLGDEFPEYQKMIDGTAEREAAERKKAEEDRRAAKEADVSGLGKGFMAIEVEEEEEEDEDDDEDDNNVVSVKAKVMSSTQKKRSAQRKAKRAQRRSGRR